MQYRPVGNTGVKVSALGIGTMRFKGKDNAAEIIRHGLGLGLTYFDIGSAYSYSSFDDNAETWTGAGIQGVPRDRMVLSAKAHHRIRVFGQGPGRQRQPQDQNGAPQPIPFLAHSHSRISSRRGPSTMGLSVKCID